MAKHTPIQRLPLRDLVTHLENKYRELNEHLRMDLSANVNELHRMTRPKRNKSSYPSIRAICTTHQRVIKAEEYAAEVCDQIEACVKEIQSRAAARS